MNIPVPEYAELKYLKKIKIIDEENDLGESGYNLFESYLYQQKYRSIFSIYVVCAGQHSSSIPTFSNAIGLMQKYPPIFKKMFLNDVALLWMRGFHAYDTASVS